MCIWATELTKMQYGCRKLKSETRQQPLRSLCNAVARLNRAFPQFSSDAVEQYPTIQNVQKPLREAFCVLVDAQMRLLSHINDSITHGESALHIHWWIYLLTHWSARS